MDKTLIIINRHPEARLNNFPIQNIIPRSIAKSSKFWLKKSPFAQSSAFQTNACTPSMVWISQRTRLFAKVETEVKNRGVYFESGGAWKYRCTSLKPYFLGKRFVMDFSNVLVVNTLLFRPLRPLVFTRFHFDSGNRKKSRFFRLVLKSRRGFVGVTGSFIMF